MGVRSKKREAQFDVVVVGGGMTGICAAKACARMGVKTALVHARPVLGGNASSEIRMHICGATGNGIKKNLEETGILLELELENKRHNDTFNFSTWDAVLFNSVKQEENLTTFFNADMFDCDMEGDRITGITCYQGTTEILWHITGQLFIDCTGNLTLGFYAGADYAIGREDKQAYGEPHAMDVADNQRMGNTLLFQAVRRDHPVKFEPPVEVYHFTEHQLRYRHHGNTGGLYSMSDKKMGTTILDGTNKMEKGNKEFEAYCLEYGYWWVEIPGHEEDVVAEGEAIRDELVKCVYGIWNHIKNEGDHGAENHELVWVGMLPGTRESRRMQALYMINENDILGNRVFDDTVAYGGWPMDVHVGGLFNFDNPPSFIYSFPGSYTIPLRSYISRNVPNLMGGGRALGASKLAMSSARVMGTCAVGGQAMGTAAALAIKYGCDPAEVGEKHIRELQQQLMLDDCYLPGFKNEDERDLARKACVTATSEVQGCEAVKVINGVARSVEEESNMWQSAPLAGGVQTLKLSWEQPQAVSMVQLAFDTDLSRATKITMSSKRQAQQVIGVPPELVRDYDLVLLKDGKEVACEEVRDNYQRLNRVNFDKVECDEVQLRVLKTGGVENARVFEVRVY